MALRCHVWFGCPKPAVVAAAPELRTTSFGWITRRDDFDLANGSVSLSDGLTVFATGEDIRLESNVRTTANPVRVTLLAAEEIEIRGNVNITPAKTLTQSPFGGVPLQLWANEEIEINGGTTLNSTGLVYAGEEFECGGNGTINGHRLAPAQAGVFAVGYCTLSGTRVGLASLRCNLGSTVPA